jgi:hypothetical protein
LVLHFLFCSCYFSDLHFLLVVSCKVFCKKGANFLSTFWLISIILFISINFVFYFFILIPKFHFFFCILFRNRIKGFLFYAYFLEYVCLLHYCFFTCSIIFFCAKFCVFYTLLVLLFVDFLFDVFLSLLGWFVVLISSGFWWMVEGILLMYLFLKLLWH